MRKAKLPLLAAVHETVNGPHNVGVMDQVTLRDVDIQLSPSFLLNLHERVKGLLKVELWSGTECLLRHFEHLDLLAYNEWSGLQSLPEILAAFVTRFRDNS